MEFRVIGPVELWINGRRRDLGTPKERCVLAVLLLSPRQPVSAETLIRRVWDDPAPPRRGRASIPTSPGYAATSMTSRASRWCPVRVLT
ncbi:AfsR/SARP family transcriptional regulator [Actinomadura madurae]|uniref:AfsR/SARP family transcriptional regulator n=1 Tax=Actinomadura madurae TaxID=1993 RepID=UPI0020D256E5|nr:hypothetical protein [Actinomadura madurae]MCQ0009214.1 hypothetical protein [Actinomadura madurae]